ncbi:MAG TPA: hypothetical protein VM939_02400 [Gemmatimonadaceae bacterium]|nr:hypothetical protein [Gemmatimonadaceae bacterium]
MTPRDMKERTDSDESDPTERAAETHSGTPNAVDPNDVRSTEHKSGYGGEGGDPRTSSETRQPKDVKPD